MNRVETIQKLPNLPGIYIFKDAQGTILYVGKAKSLRTRVTSYFRRAIRDWKVHALMEEAITVDHIVAHHEHDALVLEAQLVQEHKPKYNTLLKEGNPFLYLHVTLQNNVELTRTNKGEGLFFGPFINKTVARSCYRYLMRTFKLERCAGTVTGGCLQAHIGICAGNCLVDWSVQDYEGRLRLLIEVLKGDFAKFEYAAQQQIAAFIKNLEFEKAQHIVQYLDDWHHMRSVLERSCNKKHYEKAIMDLLAPLPPEDLYMQGAEALQKLLALETPVRTIDCFDISHMQGHAMVGSCVRFTDGALDKAALRRFRIKEITEQNDYAALQEIVRRRYAHQPPPDIVLIDGGKGQLSAVQKVLPHNNIVALAKREERLFGTLIPEGIPLDIRTPLGKLLIQIRDYAHHTAIRYHRLLRRKGVS